MIVARPHPLRVLPLLALLVVAGCGQTTRPAAEETAAPSAGAEVRELDSESGTRSYRLYEPENAETSPALVVMLHGGGGSAVHAERAYGWNELADQEGFLVVYPEGLNHAWNAGGGCCGRSGRDDVDDVGFLLALIDELETTEGVDPARLYVTGMSNGAMMSYALACSTDAIAAIAPVAGTMLADCTEPSPVSVLHIHGTADSNVPLEGGLGDGVAAIESPPIASIVEHWRTVAACTLPTVTTAGPVQHSLAYCAEGREVQLTTVEGAGHQWPGSEGVRGSADPPSQGVNATETIWRFFAANPHP